MLIKHQMEEQSSQEGQSEEIISEVFEDLLKQLNHLVIPFDPNIYNKESLFGNISAFLEDFTERTQIECTIKEAGTPQSIPFYSGISIIRIIHEILETIEIAGSANHIHVALYWSPKSIKIHVKDDSTTVEKNFIPRNSMFFIEERTALLFGNLSYKIQESKPIEFTSTIPLNEESESNDIE